MLDKKTDKRILHTKFFLKNALLDLMKTKPIEKITTTELCAAADINRNTFYSHYSTPEEVLEEIVNEELGEVKALLSNSSDRERLHNLYSHFKEKKELCFVSSGIAAVYPGHKEILLVSQEEYA